MRGAEPPPRGCPQTSRKPGVKQRGVIGGSSGRGTTERQGDVRSWRLASSGGGREASLEQVLRKLPREEQYLDTKVVSFNPVSTGASQGSRQGHRSTEGQTGRRHSNDDNIRVVETGGLRKSPPLLANRDCGLAEGFVLIDGSRKSEGPSATIEMILCKPLLKIQIDCLESFKGMFREAEIHEDLLNRMNFPNNTVIRFRNRQ